MIYDKARELSRMLAESEEYKAYKETREKALANETTKALIQEYHQLQMKAQAALAPDATAEELLREAMKIIMQS